MSWRSPGRAALGATAGGVPGKVVAAVRAKPLARPAATAPSPAAAADGGRASEDQRREPPGGVGVGIEDREAAAVQEGGEDVVGGGLPPKLHRRPLCVVHEP